VIGTGLGQRGGVCSSGQGWADASATACPWLGPLVFLCGCPLTPCWQGALLQVQGMQLCFMCSALPCQPQGSGGENWASGMPCMPPVQSVLPVCSKHRPESVLHGC
jgi:hypothetical protein